jgi:hypothetical protein
MGSTANNLMGARFPQIKASTEKLFSLYDFLLKHKDEGANRLAAVTTMNGEPLFTKEVMASMLEVIERQKNLPYVLAALYNSKKAPQKGGAPTKVFDLVEDPTRTKFWDKFVHKIMHPIAQRIPDSWDGVLYYVFFLYQLEHMEFIGPIVSTGLDTLTLSIPVLSEFVTEIAGKLIEIIPLPYMGYAGDLVGIVVGLLFAVFASTLNTSRKHFGSAFTSLLEGIPIVGDVLMLGAMQFQTGAERYLVNRSRILNELKKISPTTTKIANYWAPNTVIHDEPMPKLDINKIKDEGSEFIENRSPIAPYLPVVRSVYNQYKDYASFDNISKTLQGKAKLPPVPDFKAIAAQAAAAAATAAVKKGVNRATTAATAAATAAANSAENALKKVVPSGPKKSRSRLHGGRRRYTRKQGKGSFF